MVYKGIIVVVGGKDVLIGVVMVFGEFLVLIDGIVAVFGT